MIYSWYAVANDSLLENKSSTWSFSTKILKGGGGIHPIADANGPYYEVLIDGEAEVKFDGSGSIGTITLYTWDFGDEEIGYSVSPTHTYTSIGKYHVNLTVSGPAGSDINYTYVIISDRPNYPPKTPTISGPTIGYKNTSYEYTALSFDPDNDTITYIFNWSDEPSPKIIKNIPNGTTAKVSRSFDNYGLYKLKVIAKDNYTESAEVSINILIDIAWVDGIGYLINEDSNGTFDLFYNNATKDKIPLEMEDLWTYLIDNDGDGKRDYAYNITTKIKTIYYNFVHDKFFKIYQKQTPGFELLTLLMMIALVTIILKKRKR